VASVLGGPVELLDQVQAEVEAVAAGRHIAPVGIRPGAGAHAEVVAGQPLGLVPGDGIAVVDPRLVLVAPAGHIPARQQDHLAVVGGDGEGPLAGIEGDDLAAGAVHHSQPGPGVAAADHPVADPELPLTNLQSIRPEAAVLGHPLTSSRVQPGDLGSGEGDHPRLLAAGEPLPPVADLDSVGFRLAATHDHLAVLHQPVHGLLGTMVAEQGGHLVAELGALAVIAPELRGAEAEAEGAEGAISVDGGQLPVIADHDHLASGPIDVSQELGEVAGADHRRLINYHDGVTIEPFGPSAELPKEAIDRGRRRVRLSLELAGGRPGRRRTDHVKPGAAEGVHRGPGGIGLARAGVADHQRDPGAVPGDLADHRRLVLI
jgi:hypothetical protein